MDYAVFSTFISAIQDKSVLRKLHRIVKGQLKKLEETDMPKKVTHPLIPYELLIERKRKKSYNKNLQNLLDEDWSYLYEQYSDKPAEYCVYLHGRPDKARLVYTALDCETFMNPIYVGMGNIDRPFIFKRAVFHEQCLRALESEYKREDIVNIVAIKLSERTARILEAKLILFFGIKNTTNSKARATLFHQCKPALLNNKYEPMPDKYKNCVSFFS